MQNKLKPFDLAAALAGAAVVDGTGTLITELHHFKGLVDDAYSVCGIRRGSLEKYTDDGQYYHYRKDANEDLFMAPVMVQCWVNVYRDQWAAPYFGVTYKSEAAATANVCASSGEYISTIMLWERAE